MGRFAKEVAVTVIVLGIVQHPGNWTSAAMHQALWWVGCMSSTMRFAGTLVLDCLWHSALCDLHFSCGRLLVQMRLSMLTAPH